MAPMRNISDSQLQKLVDFAESNTDLLLGNRNVLMGNKANIMKTWHEMATELNSIGTGATKTALQWKRYWHVLKCRTKAKAADIRRQKGGTDGGSNKLVPLTEIENRIMGLIGEAVVEVTPKKEVKVSAKVRQPQRIRIDKNVPRWAVQLEVRRINAENRLAEHVTAMVETQKELARSMEKIGESLMSNARSQAVLVKLLRRSMDL